MCMPRLRTHSGSPPDYGKLYAQAESQAGYFTTSQSAESGFSRPLLHHHVQANRFERVAHGIYRLVHFPPGDNEDLVVTWLWSGREGSFSHETALALHELSDALPTVQHLTLPVSWKGRRVRVPPGVAVHYADLPAKAVTWKGPIRVTTPLRTVVDCIRENVDPTLVAQAVTQGLERGQFGRDELETAVGSPTLRALLSPRRKKTKK